MTIVNESEPTEKQSSNMSITVPLAVFNQLLSTIKFTLSPETVYAVESTNGRFDGLLSVRQIGIEDIAKFTDSKGRVGVVLFTPIGNVVIYQQDVRWGDRFMCDVAPALEDAIPRGLVYPDYIKWILAVRSPNRVRRAISTVHSAVERKQ